MLPVFIELMNVSLGGFLWKIPNGLTKLIPINKSEEQYEYSSYRYVWSW
ncbi:hypothetical protein QFZ78_000167 [Paenibacillus sp. V4I5]|nr:hypothetical protein [Paenibacillus sp. V4I5]